MEITLINYRMTSLINRHFIAYAFCLWPFPFASSMTQVCDWQAENVHAAASSSLWEPVLMC